MTTIKNLEWKIKVLNEHTNNPVETYTVDKKSKDIKANIGNYHLYRAYGSFALHQICNEGGGTTDIFSLTTKKELYDLISSMIEGIKIGKNCIIRNL
jgi:hypothetical protein